MKQGRFYLLASVKFLALLCHEGSKTFSSCFISFFRGFSFLLGELPFLVICVVIERKNFSLIPLRGCLRSFNLTSISLYPASQPTKLPSLLKGVFRTSFEDGGASLERSIKQFFPAPVEDDI